jgi:4-carboxymuconolactone decarboxylase
MVRRNLKPAAFRRLALEHTDFLKAVNALGSAAQHAGPLDEKVTQLVQLAAAAAIRSEGGVHSHARRALDLGASREEIHHALICITSTIGFPTVRAALSWADDVLGNSGTRKKPRRSRKT